MFQIWHLSQRLDIFLVMTDSSICFWFKINTVASFAALRKMKMTTSNLAGKYRENKATHH